MLAFGQIIIVVDLLLVVVGLDREQDRLIEEGYFDYIITTYYFEENWDNYEFVQEAAGTYVNYDRTSYYEGFKLYKRVQE
jgi:hypothetical protein